MRHYVPELERRLLLIISLASGEEQLVHVGSGMDEIIKMIGKTYLLFYWFDRATRIPSLLSIKHYELSLSAESEEEVADNHELENHSIFRHFKDSNAVHLLPANYHALISGRILQGCIDESVRGGLYVQNGFWYKPRHVG